MGVLSKVTPVFGVGWQSFFGANVDDLWVFGVLVSIFVLQCSSAVCVVLTSLVSSIVSVACPPQYNHSTFYANTIAQTERDHKSSMMWRRRVHQVRSTCFHIRAAFQRGVESQHPYQATGRCTCGEKGDSWTVIARQPNEDVLQVSRARAIAANPHFVILIVNGHYHTYLMMFGQGVYQQYSCHRLLFTYYYCTNSFTNPVVKGFIAPL